MIKDYFKIALQSLKRRGIRSWLTMLGIFIGIAAVVSLISLGAGLKLAVADQFNILGAERITIRAVGLQTGPPGTNAVRDLTKEDLDIIKKTKGVKVAAGRLIETSIVNVDGKSYVAFLGSEPKDLREKDWIHEVADVDIEFGRDLKPSDKNKIVIGSDYHIKETFGRNLNLGDKIKIKGVAFEIVGINRKRGSFITDGILLMNENVMRKLYGVSDKYSIIVAKATNIKKMDLLVEKIKKNLRKYRNLEEGKEDFEIKTSQQSLETISKTLDIVTILLSGIAAISLLVGGIGIMNTMYTAVLERRADIGIMKAIGAKNKDIFILFFIESGLLGLVGGIIGIIIGIIIGKLVEVIGTVALGSNLLKASFTPELIISALLFSFVVGSLAGTLPAIGAARLNPVDALRD